MAAVETIAGASLRLAALMFGAADMAADLGAATAWAPLAYARSGVVLACGLAGIVPIDSPFFDVREAEGLVNRVKNSIASDFSAKAASHPGQVGTINNASTQFP